jgi:hypothetical protein|tara:strand:+ start:854 stop:1063 length:210 start_codon:yes stop_codon:yes gene_type:complete
MNNSLVNLEKVRMDKVLRNDFERISKNIHIDEVRDLMKQAEEVIIETVHGVQTKVKIPYVRLIEIDELI